MWEVNNYHMTSIESRTLKALMNLRILTMSKYPVAFRFIQVPSFMFQEGPTNKNWNFTVVYTMASSMCNHTHNSHTCFAPKKNIAYQLFQHVEGKNKNGTTNGRSPRLPLTKGHPDLLRNPPPSSESSPAEGIHHGTPHEVLMNQGDWRTASHRSVEQRWNKGYKMV